jgi:hypothetical protein
MDNINLYEWKTSINVVSPLTNKSKIIFRILTELRKCGFTDIQCIGNNTIYVTGLEKMWVDFILSSPDLYEYLIKPRRIYYGSEE